jgi:hypothetical protein
VITANAVGFSALQIFYCKVINAVVVIHTYPELCPITAKVRQAFVFEDLA